MRIYLSGPMTGIKDNNVPKFMKEAKRLRRKGYRVINPAELDKVKVCRTWEECLRRDLEFVVKCDAIATLPGWTKSRGANLEIHVGRALSMPIHSVEYYTRGRK